MTRKFYILTTLIEGTPTAISSKAVTSPSADSGATASQINDIRNSGVQVLAHTTPGIWLRRASARAAAAYLTNLTNATGNAYSVKEVGEFKRTVRPIKGYRVEVNYHRGQRGLARWEKYGDSPDLIDTRAAARAFVKNEKERDALMYDNPTPWSYRIVTVYADA